MAASMAHALRVLWLPCMTLLTLLARVAGDDYDFDNQNYPGIQYELKFEVGAGDEQCFFQKVKKGATLVVSFEVLRGADRNVDVVISKPDGTVLDNHLWTNMGTTEKETDVEGTYKFCVDNKFSRFSSKLVYLYIMGYVSSDWEQYAKDLEDFEFSVTNVTSSMQAIEEDLAEAKRHMRKGVQHAMTDWYIMRTNNLLIRNMSLLLCACLIITSILQVIFVRNLFKTQRVTPTNKPRA